MSHDCRCVFVSIVSSFLFCVGFGQPPTGVSRKVFEPLESMRTRHPRIFLDDRKLEDVKASILCESLAKKHFTALSNWFDQRMAKKKTPVYTEPKTDYWEGLELRGIGEEMVGMAFLYRVTKDTRYLEAAKRWSLAVCAFPKWGKYDKRGYTINDLGGSTLQFGLALVYDWLYHELSDSERKTIRDALAGKTREVYDYAAVRKEAFWVKVPMHNHNWINTGGVLMAGLSLYGEVEEAGDWLTFATGQYDKSFSSYFETGDGASHEGYAYWDYGTKKAVIMLSAMKELLGVDYFSGNAWLRNTVDFGIYSSLPLNGWKSRDVRKEINGLDVSFTVPVENGMTFGDGPRRTWGIPTSYMLKLSGLYKSGAARWFAERTSASDTECTEDQWMEVLWDDPTVRPEGTGSKPLSRHFENLGLVIARSGWDGGENVSGFKCGPPGGHAAIDLYGEHPGTGHSAPDAGSFQIFAYSNWLFVGPGYAEKFTAYQNTLTVNGFGQLDEGKPYYWASTYFEKKLHPKIQKFEIVSNGMNAVARVEDAYPKESGLVKFRRHFLYRRPALWLVVDELEAAKPSVFENRIHSDFPFVAEGPDRHLAVGLHGTLSVKHFASVALGVQPAFQTIKYIQPPKTGPAGLHTLAMRNEQAVDKMVMVQCFEAFPSTSASAIKIEYNPHPIEGRPAAIRILSIYPNGKNLQFDLGRDASGDLTVSEMLSKP